MTFKNPELAAAVGRANGHAPRPSWRDNVMSAPDLCDQKFPELKFLVPGLFPEGVTLIVSRPKLGKSWLLLQVGAAIAKGVHVLASGDHDALEGDVLYLNLEDGDRKAQRRMTKHFGALRQNWPSRMTIARKWRGFDQGGIDDLREWCKSVDKPTQISIDTLKRVRPPKKAGQTDYDADYEACQGLLQLAHEFPGLGVLVAHHDRKMDAEDVFDTVSGTLGLIGGVDTIAVLKRKAQGITLHVEGRDLVDGVEKAMAFDRETCRWQVLGEAAEINRSAERTRVLDALKAAGGPLSVSEIKAAAELKTREAADKLLQRMAKDEQVVRRDRGKYGLPDTLESHPASEASEASETHRNPRDTGISESDTTSDTSPAKRPIAAPMRALPDTPISLRRPSPNPARAPALGPPGDSLDDLDGRWR